MFSYTSDFNFQYDELYTVPKEYEGRPDLIAYEKYGDVRLYIAICKANNINISYKLKFGIRPTTDKYSTRVELEDDWQSYFNEWAGSIVGFKAGDRILIPSAVSASNYLDLVNKRP